jgi:hypothetical protein
MPNKRREVAYPFELRWIAKIRLFSITIRIRKIIPLSILVKME